MLEERGADENQQPFHADFYSMNMAM